MSSNFGSKIRFNEKNDPGLIEYLRDHNIDSLKDYIITKIQANGLENVNLITIAKINNDTAGLVKELVISNQIDNNELANQIAKEILADIELQVDLHLKKYQRFTLNAPIISPVSSNSRDDSHDQSTAQFFNLISLLKDVSVLGRQLLEMAPHFNAQKSLVALNSVLSSDNLVGTTDISETKSIKSHKSQASNSTGEKCKYLRDEDATSEDLLAALIDSSSSDDFLVLTSSLETITSKEMILAAMIYIKSHECFTLSHDIHGVVLVLRRIKFLIINILAPKNQVELITKLLTSIGRYSEMNYVFDLFRDRNQFEVLLSKGVEKTPELRIALFNYVKKNPEFYALVTLNFSMFREIAESLEASANKRLNKLMTNDQTKTDQRPKKKSSTILASIGNSYSLHQSSKDFLEVTNDSYINSTPSLSLSSSAPSSSSSSIANRAPVTLSKETYNLALMELVDASDCYSKAGCYKKSKNCERKAKLVALQIALLNNNKSKIDVLNVNQANLIDFITNFENFQEAYIIADGYDCHVAWRQALFKNVILGNNMIYLEKFCEKCHLSSALVEELVLLYKQYLNTHKLKQDENSYLSRAIEKLISKLRNIELKCKLYNQLNLFKAKEELLQDQATRAHLKDLKLA